jgi:hypothetical protein
MTQDAVEKLAQLARLTYQDRVVVDWVEAERELGQQLPTDYKEFATRFGPGHFEDGYRAKVIRWFATAAPFVPAGCLPFGGRDRTYWETRRT